MLEERINFSVFLGFLEEILPENEQRRYIEYLQILTEDPEIKAFVDCKLRSLKNKHETQLGVVQFFVESL